MSKEIKDKNQQKKKKKKAIPSFLPSLFFFSLSLSLSFPIFLSFLLSFLILQDIVIQDSSLCCIRGPWAWPKFMQSSCKVQCKVLHCKNFRSKFKYISKHSHAPLDFDLMYCVCRTIDVRLPPFLSFSYM